MCREYNERALRVHVWEGNKTAAGKLQLEVTRLLDVLKCKHRVTVYATMSSECAAALSELQEGDLTIVFGEMIGNMSTMEGGGDSVGQLSAEIYARTGVHPILVPEQHGTVRVLFCLAR